MKNWVVDLMKGSETRARKDLEERSGISRREFLAGALAAGAGSVILPNIISAPKAYAGTLSSTASRLMPDYATATAFQGTVVSTKSNQLYIDLGNGMPIESVALDSKSELWRLGAFRGGLPSVGDDIVVRSAVPGVL